MVDYATRYPEALALKTIKAMTCHSAEALVEMWSRLGIPTVVPTDRGTQFTSDVMRQVNRLLSINHHCTTPYHAHPVQRTRREVQRDTEGHVAQAVSRTVTELGQVIPALLFSSRAREVRQESQTQVIRKYAFLNSFQIYINPLSSQSTKPITSLT